MLVAEWGPGNYDGEPGTADPTKEAQGRGLNNLLGGQDPPVLFALAHACPSRCPSRLAPSVPTRRLSGFRIWLVARQNSRTVACKNQHRSQLRGVTAAKWIT